MDALIPIALFTMIAVIVVGPIYLRSRDRQQMLETMRVAFERGQPVPPDMMEALQRRDLPAPRATPERDFRTGVILIAVALAFLVTGGVIYWAEGEDEAMAVFTAMAAFPGLIGLAFLAFWLGKRGRSDDPRI